MKRAAVGARRTSVSQIFLALMLVVNMAATGCGSTAMRTSGNGVIVGGIRPCAALETRGGPRYSAGTVQVLQGKTSWLDIGPGQKTVVLPSKMLAEAVIAQDASYRFELPAGLYVLKADYSPPTVVHPFVNVEVKAGTLLQQDIPNMCI